MLSIAVCIAWVDWTVMPACADRLYMLQPPKEAPAFTSAPLLPVALRREEVRRTDASTQIFVERLEIEGRDPDKPSRPRGTLEQRFANALNAGNPEVGGGQIRHGTYYDGLVYWGSDPLSFVYYNIRNRLFE